MDALPSANNNKAIIFGSGVVIYVDEEGKFHAVQSSAVPSEYEAKTPKFSNIGLWPVHYRFEKYTQDFYWADADTAIANFSSLYTKKVTLSAGVTPLTRLLDMVLILRRLQSCGYTEEMTGSLYGIYSTLAIPLYSLLPMLIGSLALPIVPGIARARERGELAAEREIVNTSLRLTCLLGLPASMGLAAFSYPILNLLFGTGDTAAAIAQAAPLLRVLGISVLGGCLVTVLGAMLQAYGQPRVPLYAMLAGSAVKLGMAWILLGIPRVGMLGAPISTFLCHFTVILIETAVLCRHIPHGISLRGFTLRTCGAALCAVGGTVLLWQTVDRYLSLPRLAVTAAVVLCVFVYLVLCLRLGVLRREDVIGLSHGEAIWQLFIRLKWVPSGEKVVIFTEKNSEFSKTS